LRGFQQRLSDFESRGVRVVAVSADPPETSRDYRAELGLTFPILSDEKGEVLRRYDVLHAGGSPDKTDISRPAEFLVDSTGTVRWANVTKSVVIRAMPDEVLKAFDATRAAAR
jgi:peroxiredoxin Q/BCP